MIAALSVLLLLAPAGDAPPCVDAASELLRAGRHQAAAIDAERCWQLTRYPNALLLASQARVYALHHAHAALDLDLYREHAPTASWARETVTELSGLIRRNTGELVLAVEPPLQPGEHVWFELQFVAEARPLLQGRAARLAFRLDPGRWRLTVHRDGYADWTEEVEVSHDTLRHTAHTRPLPGPATLTVTPEPVLLRLGPPRALRRDLTVELRSDDDRRPPIASLAASGPTLALYLPPGRWRLLARARGYSATTTILTPGDGQVEVQLRRTGKR